MGRDRPRPDESPTAPDHSPTRIDLAHEGPFALAGAEVQPATREVIAGERRELLEPRVMQVLVALARRRGEVVSRDELIAQCWGGRIVGEDAVTRSIGKLRKLAEACGGFEIETVPRVGFRLVEGAAERPAGRLGLRRLVWLGVALAVALVLAVAWVWRQSLPVEAVPEPRIAVRAFEAIGEDAAARTFAAAVADQVAGALAENALGLALPGTGDGAGAVDLVLRGTVAREGDSWRVRAYLEDTRTKRTLWSEQFARPTSQEGALRDQVAAAVTGVIFTANAPLSQEGLKVDPGTLALYIRATQDFGQPTGASDPPPLSDFEKVVARAPRFAAARGALALNLANTSREAPEGEKAILERRARAEAEHAIRLDPRTGGAAFDALYMLARLDAPLDLAAAEDVLIDGITRSPEFPYLFMRECRFLIEVGRGHDARRFCDRARALRPLTASIEFSQAHALYASGDVPLAVRAAEQSARFHPEFLYSRRLRLEIAMFHGDPDEARSLLHDTTRAPRTLRPEAVHALDLFLTARRSGERADVDRAMAGLWTAARSPRFDRRYLVLCASSLGRLDDAFRALDAYGASPAPADVGVGPGVLLEPAAAPLWRDPRFWPAAAKAGYVRYWLTRDRWPDFCSDPTLPYNCRTAAGRVIRP